MFGYYTMKIFITKTGNYYLRDGLDISCTYYFPINLDQNEK